MSETDFPLPPPTFEFLIFSLKTQAEMQLGLMQFGEEKPQPDLHLARHTIDLMAVLVEKTKGNLDLDEQRLLENSLTELRFRVHHDRSVPRHRLFQRATRAKQEPDAPLTGVHDHLVAAVEQHERAVACLVTGHVLDRARLVGEHAHRRRGVAELAVALEHVRERVPPHVDG